MSLIWQLYHVCWIGGARRCRLVQTNLMSQRNLLCQKIYEEHVTHFLLDVMDGNATGFIHLNVHP